MSAGIGIPVTGRSYQRTVPDTVDLAERARLALHGMAGTIDPAMGTNWFFVVYANRRPYLCHHVSDNEIDPKIAGCFPMMRVMCGETAHLETELLHRRALLSRIEDGFYWNRHEPDKPWKHRDAFYTDRIYTDVRPEDITFVFSDGRMIRHLVEWMDLGGGDWGRLAGELSAGLGRIAIRRDDYAYYPDGGFGGAFAYPRRSGWLRTEEPRSEVEGAEGSVVAYLGNQIQGLAKWHAASGDRDALDLAGRLARFAMHPGFWGGTPHPEKKEALLNRWADRLPDPACVAGHELGHWYTHFHARAICLRGLLEHGAEAGDDRALDFVRRSYEFSRTVGIPQLGFVNCTPAISGNMEACALGDLVGLAIRLSDYGQGDWWDDVDACLRNHLVESQLTDRGQLERVVEHSPAWNADHYGWPAFPVHDRQGCFEDVIGRSLGLFGSAVWPAHIPEPWIMQCCTGNAVDALYYAWEGALRENGDAATVNLLVNRAGRLVDVDSWIPYEGRVEIANKAAARILVRLPGWVPLREARFSVDGRPREPLFAGRNAIIDGLRPGNLVRLDAPLREWRASFTNEFRTRHERTYRITFRGGTAVDIADRDGSPTSYHLYLRDRIRDHPSGAPAPMRKVERFVADRLIKNW